jgi:hypothetical protein
LLSQGVVELFEDIIRTIEASRGEPLPKGKGAKKAGGDGCDLQ